MTSGYDAWLPQSRYAPGSEGGRTPVIVRYILLALVLLGGVAYVALHALSLLTKQQGSLPLRHAPNNEEAVVESASGFVVRSKENGEAESTAVGRDARPLSFELGELYG